MGKYTSIGGQALIEGILMKSPEKTALAVRCPDKSIDITYLDRKSLREKYKICRLPIIRGVVSFVESMLEGYKAMMLSADKSGFSDLEEDKAEKGQEKKESSWLMSVVMIIATVLGVALSVVLFMLIPSLFVDGIEFIFKLNLGAVAISLIEQLLKLSIFVGYVWIVSFMKDIKRVFMYHGAEHKTIFAYEKGLELNVGNVKAQRRFHPRCGTSFMILMILISTVFSTLIQIIAGEGLRDITALWVAVKILMIPLICGVGFELLKICGKYDNAVTRIISAPGLWLQRITTKEPEEDMIEIAIAALKACEPENPDVDRAIDDRSDKEGENDNI